MCCLDGDLHSLDALYVLQFTSIKVQWLQWCTSVKNMFSLHTTCVLYEMFVCRITLIILTPFCVPFHVGLVVSCRSVRDNTNNWYDLYWVWVVFMFQLDLLTLTWLQFVFIVTVTLHFADPGSCFCKIGSWRSLKLKM